MNDTSNELQCIGNSRTKVTIYADKNKPFTVGNKHCKGVGSLWNGFLVVHASERYPCFDSSDFVYENRFYHWFFLCASLSKFLKVKKLLKKREIPLRQFYPATVLNTWDKYYSGLCVSMVYCEDDSERLIVVENI